MAAGKKNRYLQTEQKGCVFVSHALNLLSGHTSLISDLNNKFVNKFN